MIVKDINGDRFASIRQWGLSSKVELSKTLIDLLESILCRRSNQANYIINLPIGKIYKFLPHQAVKAIASKDRITGISIFRELYKGLGEEFSAIDHCILETTVVHGSVGMMSSVMDEVKSIFKEHK